MPHDGSEGPRSRHAPAGRPDYPARPDPETLFLAFQEQLDVLDLSIKAHQRTLDSLIQAYRARARQSAIVVIIRPSPRRRRS